LELITERIKQHNLTAHKLIASSDKSWEMRDRINLNPLFIQPPPSAEKMQSQPLAYLLEGEFPSFFEGKPIPVREVETEESDPSKDKQPSEEKTEDAQSTAKDGGPEPAAEPSKPDVSQIASEGQFTPKGKPAKIFIMASSDMFKDNVLDTTGRHPNSAFVMNIVDYLNGREDIAVMRGKEQRLNPLDDTTASVKTFVKTFNIAGLPILIVLFGLSVWFRRHARKRHIQMMFHK
jgi:ABC-type uncharacterized transport system involved in gliding motility auxiliary subunit